MTKSQHTPEPWKISYRAQKQSNYGKYKAGLFRGEGKELEVVNITADTGELALEIARNAAAAHELLDALKAARNYITHPAVVNSAIPAGKTLVEIDAAIANAEGK